MWICARSFCRASASRSFPAASHASRCARTRLSSTRRRAAAARTRGCFMAMSKFFSARQNFMLSRVAHSLYWMGPLHRARREHRAPRGREPAASARPARFGRGTAGEALAADHPKHRRREGFFQIASARDRPGRHGVSRLSGGESELHRAVHLRRARETPAWCATSSRSNCGRS